MSALFLTWKLLSVFSYKLQYLSINLSLYNQCLDLCSKLNSCFSVSCMVLSLAIWQWVIFFLLHGCDWRSSTNCLHSHNRFISFQICFTISMTPFTIYRAKNGNIQSEFTYSNWITLSTIQALNIKNLFPKYLLHFSHHHAQ